MIVLGHRSIGRWGEVAMEPAWKRLARWWWDRDGASHASMCGKECREGQTVIGGHRAESVVGWRGT